MVRYYPLYIDIYAYPLDLNLIKRRCGRNNYSQLVQIISQAPNKHHTDLSTFFTPRLENSWRPVQFMVFDAPTLGDVEYEERMERVRIAISALETNNDSNNDSSNNSNSNRISPARVVELRKLKGKGQVLQMLSEIEDQGGEGLILRKPQAKYMDPSGLLKVQVRHLREDNHSLFLKIYRSRVD